MTGFPDLGILIPGKALGYSKWVQIDQQCINQFADVTNDYQAIHVDPEFAAGTPFGSTVAHGYLTLSLFPKCLFELLEPLGVDCTVINYGANKIRFLEPVQTDSRLRLHISVKQVDQKPTGYLVTFNATMEIEGTDKPAFVAELLMLMIPK